MSEYAARVEDGLVVDVIAGSPEWATERLGGEWKSVESVVGLGWSWTKTYGFRPPKPHGSWRWSDGAWRAPSPRPEGFGWRWDEDSKSWALSEELLKVRERLVSERGVRGRLT